MEQSPWEANSFSASQEIPWILLNPNVEPVSCSFHEPAQSNAHHYCHVLKDSYLYPAIHTYVSPSDFPISSECIFHLSRVCYVPDSSQLPWLGHFNDIWSKVEIMWLFIVQFPPSSLLKINKLVPFHAKKSFFHNIGIPLLLYPREKGFGMNWIEGCTLLLLLY